MKRSPLTLLCLFMLSGVLQASLTYEELTKDFVVGKAAVQSLSVMTFGPEGILFIGDAKGGEVFALDVNDRKKNPSVKGFGIADIDAKVGDLLGTDAKGVIIHDFA